MLISLIDADLVAYRCAASAENDGRDIAIARADKLMRIIIDKTQATSYKAFLTGDNNFRKEINPLYKANRKDTVAPRFLQQCREFLVVEWGASVTDGYEADDALGIEQTKQSKIIKDNWEGEFCPISETIICSIDKDLLMIPGKHYNFVRDEFSEVSELDGIKAFYRQMLIGDSSDNIFGIDGIGKVKAGKIIDPLEYEIDMYTTVFNMYECNTANLKQNEARFNMNADCLWIWRKEEERFSNRRDV